MANPRHPSTLANAFVYAAECTLATLDELLGIRSTSKSRISRQRGICLTMLKALHPHRESIDWGGEYAPYYSRVHKILGTDSLKDVEAHLDAHIDELNRIYRR